MAPRSFDDLTSRLVASFDEGMGFNDTRGLGLPDRETIAKVCDRFLTLCFPGFFSAGTVSREDLKPFIRRHLAEQDHDLTDQIMKARCFARHCAGKEVINGPEIRHQAGHEVYEVLQELSEIRDLLATDLQAAYDNDPAATGPQEVIVSYPFLEAIAVQRIAHRLYQRGVPFVPRMMTEVAHSRTGIDIHPGANIDESFFIDHGTGVVIGETCNIGKHCVLYHGVTLGAFNPLWKDDSGELPRGSSNKRHPDLEDHVTVYPGATILGGKTLIGHHSIVGGNVWLTTSVEPFSRITIKDPDLVFRQKQQPNIDFNI